MRKPPALTTFAIGLAGGGLAGLALGISGFASAAPSTTRSPSATSPAQPTPKGGGTFTPNEDPTHESAESPEQEAAEDSGQAFRGGGHGWRGGSNEDPAHEKAESPEREAQEDANSGGQAPATQPPSSAPSTPTS